MGKMYFDDYGELDWLEPSEYFAGAWKYLRSAEGEAGKQVVSISINAAKWENARREAARLGISISEYIESRI